MSVGCGLNLGLNVLLDLLMGAAGTAFNNANSRIKVGDSDTAANPSQTDVLGTAITDTLDPTHPSVSGQTITVQATYGAGAITNRIKEVSWTNGATGLLRIVLATDEQYTPVGTDIVRVKVDLVAA